MIDRREFMLGAAAWTAAVAAAASGRGRGAEAGQAQRIDNRDYLSRILLTRQEIDDWFAGQAFEFEQYDGELGWVLRNVRLVDGIDGSTSTYRYGPLGERLMINHADRPCRVNTYGNSFTQCHQVSDGETWQEVLAAHLGEPIRNFGVGGYSVYQAYRRMLREESRSPADAIIFNVYSDDHYRNLTGWRIIRRGSRRPGPYMLPTLPHLRVDLSTGECEEHENPCPTKESVYNLCDLDWVEERFRDDFVLGIRLGQVNAKDNPDFAHKALDDVARRYHLDRRIDRRQPIDAVASEIYTQAGLSATMKVIEWVDAFANRSGKKVLYVLSFARSHVARRLQQQDRFDQPIVDFLDEKGLPYVDLLEAHASDYADFSASVGDYLKRYYIGHYNPLGNSFTAFAVKDRLVELLNPKPAAYRPP
ncbi:MAG: hypothetical protein ACYTG0_33960 [Planctomycetota bacterium]|jgi:hypothetical protein